MDWLVDIAVCQACERRPFFKFDFGVLLCVLQFSPLDDISKQSVLLLSCSQAYANAGFNARRLSPAAASQILTQPSPEDAPQSQDAFELNLRPSERDSSRVIGFGTEQHILQAQTTPSRPPYVLHTPVIARFERRWADAREDACVCPREVKSSMGAREREAAGPDGRCNCERTPRAIRERARSRTERSSM